MTGFPEPTQEPARDGEPAVELRGPPDPPAPALTRAILAGVRLGHWSDPLAGTGCSVMLFPAGTVASGEVRGGAPGTREWELLAPQRTVQRVDAVFLSGGSAFGLAVGDGVSRWCEERGMGYPTPAGPVPIVVGAVLYDLDVGDPRRRPGAEEGYAACVDAGELPSTGTGGLRLGAVGAGTGARVSRRRGPAGRRPGGLGWAVRVDGELVVGALMAVNAAGDILPVSRAAAAAPGELPGEPPGMSATTIGVVVTNARLDKLGCFLVAQSAHDGLARALDPVHTSSDGDAVVAAATGEVDAPADRVRMLAAASAEEAVRAGVATTPG